MTMSKTFSTGAACAILLTASSAMAFDLNGIAEQAVENANKQDYNLGKATEMLNNDATQAKLQQALADPEMQKKVIDLLDEKQVTDILTSSKASDLLGDKAMSAETLAGLGSILGNQEVLSQLTSLLGDAEIQKMALDLLSDEQVQSLIAQAPELLKLIP